MEEKDNENHNQDNGNKTENGDETDNVAHDRVCSPVKEVQKDKSKAKVDVLLKATGDAPIMKKKKWAVDKNKPVSYLCDFIKKFIKCEPSESLFIYVNQTFVPAPDQLISNLYDCFGTDGKLVLHYCKTQAWG